MLKQSRPPSCPYNIRRGVWVPDRRSLCSLVRDDVGREYASAFSRHGFARGLQIPLSSPSKEGAGKAGCRLTPAVSCAKTHSIGAHEHTGSAETARLSPRNGFTAYFVLSPVSGLFCHRHLAKNFPQGLAPASRRQDHTTSPYALAFSSGAKNTPDAKASIAFRPNAT